MITKTYRIDDIVYTGVELYNTYKYSKNKSKMSFDEWLDFLGAEYAY